LKLSKKASKNNKDSKNEKTPSKDTNEHVQFYYEDAHDEVPEIQKQSI
jgi:hypothetical protein